jgi:hypothetical protein
VPVISVEDLAEAVNVDLADLRVVLAVLDVDGDDVPDDAVTVAHRIVTARTVVELYCPGADPESGTGATTMR